MAILLTLTLVVYGVTGIDFEIEYTPQSLTAADGQNSAIWSNEGTDAGNDVVSVYGVVQDIDGVNALCYDANTDNAGTAGLVDKIQYNTNSAVNPQLTMIIWVRPEPGYTEVGSDWLLGHDNGGYDRSIIIHDNRYGPDNIAMGVGGVYASTLSGPVAGEWTSIAVTFDKNAATATAYKNGGVDGKQATPIQGDSGSHTQFVGLNGLPNHANHYFVGCIGRVQIINRVLTEVEIRAVYDQGLFGDPCYGVECPAEEICDEGNCVRDCSLLAIDDFLGQCSTSFASQNSDIETNEAAITTNGNAITALDGHVTTECARIDAAAVDLENNLQGQIDDNTDKIDDDVAALETNLEAQIGANTDKINTDVRDLKANLQAQIDALVAEVADIDGVIAVFKKRVGRKGAQGQAGAAVVGNDFAAGVYDGDKYKPVSPIWKSSWFEMLMIVIAVLLGCNVILMTYANCCQKKRSKAQYRKVRYMDSEDVESEANLK